MSGVALLLTWSSPRERGSFCKGLLYQRMLPVFPARAGIVLGRLSGRHLTVKSSPRMRGLFWLRESCWQTLKVFPSYAGIFPRATREKNVGRVFPARAGIVLDTSRKKSFSLRLPCVRRDRSELQSLLGSQLGSSPRKRGSFCTGPITSLLAPVFPARAGIFPIWSRILLAPIRLPRACGDISGSVRQVQRAGLVFPALAGDISQKNGIQSFT